MCFSFTVGYGIIMQASLFNLYLNSPCAMLIWDFIYFCAIILFWIKGKHYSNSLLISNIENIRLMINIFFYFDFLKLLLNLQENLYTNTNLRHFTKTSTLTLPVNLSTIITISHEKVLFAFHYNYIDLHVVIPPLAHSYWRPFVIL